ncbi:MAG: single-stranded DNA-binding protein [Candidatus Dormibacteria bacterium]
MNLNRAQLIGRLTRDPEMRYTQSGTAMTKFGLATNRYGSDADGSRKEFTDFHNIVAWNQGKRNLAEICAQFLHKGSLVYVEGRLQTRSWEGQDGQKRTTTEINATDVQFLDSRGSGGGQADSASSGAAGPDMDEEFSATPGRPTAGAATAPATAAPAAHESQDIDPDDIPF